MTGCTETEVNKIMRRNVAIFPAGTEIGLEINNALKYSTHLKIYGFTSLDDHSAYVYNNIVKVPYYNRKDFIDKFNEELLNNEIDIVYPAHDDVLLFLTKNAADIKAKIITSDFKTVEICRSKKQTYEFFKDEYFVPRVYKEAEVINEYPVFVKPDIGQGSKGARLVKNEYELEYALYENKDIVICEYLSGEEYTVDCFTDNVGRLRACRMRNRKRIKSGISVNSEILPQDMEVNKIANIINGKLSFNGAWFFQLRRNFDNEFKLLEIAPRIPGTMGVSRNTGINFPLLTIFNSMNINISIIENDFNIEVDRAFINRYKTDLDYDTVYIDLDDTLIVNGKVNQTAMMFLYQLINNKKKIILLTKHSCDVKDTLNNHKICRDIFDSIIHIEKDKEKSDYITDRNSIFIDDSFSERYKVSDRLNIPVFDVDGVECLIDWRV